MQPNHALFAAVGAWIAQDPDPITKDHLTALLAAQDAEALAPLFAGRIAFGTAGLRAVMGPGPLGMNRLVVRQSTLGVANHLRTTLPEAAERGVVVAYDGRLQSAQMAWDTAGVLGAAGLKVHLFDRPVPTPVAGYAVKHLHAACGIVITASHNPPAYNGYKVFWHTAAQIVPPVDAQISAAIDAVAMAAQSVPVACWSLDDLRARNLLHMLGDATVAGYLAGIGALSHHVDVTHRDQLKIAYTPLHGVGAQVAETALHDAGFRNVWTVASQREPDGHFPTVAYPNPEEPGSMDAVLALAKMHNADLACANDPDADRLAVAARDHTGAMRALTGDELGILLADDILAHGPKGARVGTTLVSSRLLARLAASYGAHYFETLTGFKWLAHHARTSAQLGQPFAFAYEEALGYAIGDVVWDKDGISALLAVTKLAAALLAQGQTLWDRIAEIAGRIGIGVSDQRTIALDSKQAAAHMALLRQNPPKQVGDYTLVMLEDLLVPTHAQARGLPMSNVMILTLRHIDAPADQGFGPRIIVRPSGTEPKIKCYYDIIASLPYGASWANTRQQTIEKLVQLMDAHARILQKV